MLKPARSSVGPTDFGRGVTWHPARDNNLQGRRRIHEYLLDRVDLLGLTLEEFRRFYNSPRGAKERQLRRDLEEDGLTREVLEFFDILKHRLRRSDEEVEEEN